MEDLLSVTPDYMSDGEKVRYNKWSRRYQTSTPGTDSYRTAERMLKTFRSTAEATQFGMSLDDFKTKVWAEVLHRSRSAGTWHADLQGESSSLNIRVSRPNHTAVQVRVIVWPDKPDRMYFKLAGSNVQYMIPLKGTGLTYSRTLKSLVPERKVERIREAARSGQWLNESEVASMLKPKPGFIGIDMYPGAGRTARAYNYPTQSDHIHFGRTTSVDFQLDEVTKKNLDLAFNGVSQAITQTSHNNVAEREAKRMINDGARGHGNPDDMEAAALRLATLAQEIRSFDELEPSGEEPVISWTNEYQGQTYTFVAFKANKEGEERPTTGHGKWYVTGPVFGGRAYEWRDFLSADFTKGLRENGFHLVTEWTQVGGK